MGSSAIVKVSGQNCFWTLYGSLGQIRLGLTKGSAEGSTKVPAKFHQGSTKVSPRFHQGSSSFVVSLVFWGRSVLGCQKVPRYHVSTIHLHSGESDPSCLCCWGILWAYVVRGIFKTIINRGLDLSVDLQNHTTMFNIFYRFYFKPAHEKNLAFCPSAQSQRKSSVEAQGSHQPKCYSGEAQRNTEVSSRHGH